MVAQVDNDAGRLVFYGFGMAKVTKIHASKQPNRPHYIEAWADRRHMTQADLARELGADKSLVSRWYGGSTPGKDWQEKLAAFFDCDRESLFRNPDDDWLRRFFAGRSRDEIEHIKRSLEITFPMKDGTNG